MYWMERISQQAGFIGFLLDILVMPDFSALVEKMK